MSLNEKQKEILDKELKIITDIALSPGQKAAAAALQNAMTDVVIALFNSCCAMIEELDGPISMPELNEKMSLVVEVAAASFIATLKAKRRYEEQHPLKMPE